MCPPAGDNSGLRAQPESVPDCVPPDQVSQAAYHYAAQHLHPTILNHSLRVYLYAKALGDREHSPWTTADNNRLALLVTACILHDVGTTSTHDGPQRFEIEGADAASTFLLHSNPSFVVSAADAHEVWVAIALHSTPQIAERISALSRLVRLGVAIDFRRHATVSKAGAEQGDQQVEDAERAFPRGEIEQVLGDAVVAQAVKRPQEKAPSACWPGGLLRAHLEEPGWDGVNRAF